MSWTGGPRHIGPLGTGMRALVGVGLLGSVTYGHVTGTFRPAPWALGVVGFPAVLLAWHWWRLRRHCAPLQATGSVAQVLNVAVFVALYLTPEYAPRLGATQDAALVFYGGSMLLAALRGYGGCEVLSLSNWLLGRDDQLGCLVFAPVDSLEGSFRRPTDPSTGDGRPRSGSGRMTGQAVPGSRRR